MSQEELEYEKVKAQMVSQVLETSRNYFGVYEQLMPSVKRIQTHKALQAVHKKQVQACVEEFEKHAQNLRVLNEEMGQFSSREEVEQTVLLEVGLEVINKAVAFLMDLPGKFQSFGIVEGIELPAIPKKQ